MKIYSLASIQNNYSPGEAAELAGGADPTAAEGAEGPATTETKILFSLKKYLSKHKYAEFLYK